MFEGTRLALGGPPSARRVYQLAGHQQLHHAISSKHSEHMISSKSVPAMMTLFEYFCYQASESASNDSTSHKPVSHKPANLQHASHQSATQPASFGTSSLLPAPAPQFSGTNPACFLSQLYLDSHSWEPSRIKHTSMSSLNAAQLLSLTASQCRGGLAAQGHRTSAAKQRRASAAQCLRGPTPQRPRVSSPRTSAPQRH